jgi:hypothetical protein
MPNKWRLANYSFEPEVADAMGVAYRMVCAAPHLKDIGGALAEKIIEIGRDGETDPSRLAACGEGGDVQGRKADSHAGTRASDSVRANCTPLSRKGNSEPPGPGLRLARGCWPLADGDGQTIDRNSKTSRMVMVTSVRTPPPP